MSTETPTRPAASDRRSGAPRRRGRGMGIERRPGWLSYTLVVVFFVAGAYPLYWSFLMGSSDKSALTDTWPPLLPGGRFWTNVAQVFDTVPFWLALGNSLIVGAGTLLLSALIGVPAGYALARFTFPGKDPYQLFLLFTRALPIVVLSVPLARLFLTVDIYDTTYAVILLHTALALPTTILISASVFLSVPVDVEEAARLFGCSPLGAFTRVVLPMALPGLAAASIFTFVMSWNEVLGASILTLDHRPLPAQVLSSLSDSPLAYRFAGGFALVIPSIIFIALMRRYLTNMWGSTIR